VEEVLKRTSYKVAAGEARNVAAEFDIPCSPRTTHPIAFPAHVRADAMLELVTPGERLRR